MMFNPNDPTVEMKELLKQSVSSDETVAKAAAKKIAIALELPLRQGVMSGDVLGSIFEPITLEYGINPEFPLDFLSPGSEDLFVAFAVPSHGKLPERQIESDYVTVPTYEIGNVISWLNKYAKHARWDVVSRAMQVFEAGFTKKLNDDGFHTLLASAVDRNIMVYDADASAGSFTKRLISLMKVTMRRNGGGNSTSTNRRKLTDVFLSPEGIEDMRNWNVDQVDEVTRREIFLAGDGTINRIFGVNLHDMDEFGVGQVYQLYFTNSLGGSLASGGDVELVLGLDLSNRGSFIMPNRGGMELVPTYSLAESRKSGMQGTMEVGFGALDSRYVILGSF